MIEVYVKRQVPETYQECGATDCDECLFKCGSHAESFLREKEVE